MEKLVKTVALLLTVLIGFTTESRAVYPVIDVTANANLVLSYIRQGLQYIKDCEVSVNTNLAVLKDIQIIENQVLELLRMGDPSVILNLPGIQQIATLRAIYDQALIDIAKVESLVSPEGVEANCNSVLSAYGFSGFNSFTSGYGRVFAPPRPVIQFSSSSYQTDQYTEQQITKLMAKKQELTTERDTAIAGLKAATDDTTKQSYTAQINALNGAIADLNATINQQLAVAQIQVRMNSSAEKIYNGMSGAQGAANFQVGEEAGIAALTGGGAAPGTGPGVYAGAVSSTEFGYVDDPNGTFHGTGDPGTTGTWYLGDQGNYIGGTNSQGVAIPTSVQVAQFGSTAAAFGKMVTLTNPANGMTVSAPIVDVSPENKPVDLLYGTVTALGLEHNSTAPVDLTFQSQ